MRYLISIAALSCLLISACTAKPAREPLAADLEEVDVGLQTQGYRATVVADGLMNPSYVAFRPGSDALTICDTGNGCVVVIDKDGITPIITDMKTEYWKDVDGKKMFKLGPLTGAWINENKFAVSNAGVGDGDEQIFTYKISNDGAPGNEIIQRTNSVPPTTDDDIDNGEGNLSGMALLEDDKTFFVAGQGYDGKSWVLRGDIEAGTLEPWLSADDAGIEINSPMQCVAWRGNLLVIYSGAGGEEDGLAVEWDTESKKVLNQWSLGIIDPMGIAPVPNSGNEFIVTDNVWALEKVNPGKLYRVRLLNSGKVEKDLVADNVPGPVHCAFGPDGRLYVACLGWKYDNDQGQVIAIDGLERQ